MSICLLGKTCSGKTTIRDELNKLGINSVVTYTTRPMRNGERNFIDYNFISDEEFEDKKNRGVFLETTEYQINPTTLWKYGTGINAVNGDNVIILNPEGFRRIKDKGFTSFYLKCSEDVIRDRLIKRGDSIEESERRINADARDFENIESEVDFVIKSDTGLTPASLASIILTLYRGCE